MTEDEAQAALARVRNTWQCRLSRSRFGNTRWAAWLITTSSELTLFRLLRREVLAGRMRAEDVEQEVDLLFRRARECHRLATGRETT